MPSIKCDQSEHEWFKYDKKPDIDFFIGHTDSACTNDEQFNTVVKNIVDDLMISHRVISLDSTIDGVKFFIGTASPMNVTENVVPVVESIDCVGSTLK